MNQLGRFRKRKQGEMILMKKHKNPTIQLFKNRKQESGSLKPITIIMMKYKKKLQYRRWKRRGGLRFKMKKINHRCKGKERMEGLQQVVEYRNKYRNKGRWFRISRCLVVSSSRNRDMKKNTLKNLKKIKNKILSTPNKPNKKKMEMYKLMIQLLNILTNKRQHPK